jgi:hypothetical protein
LSKLPTPSWLTLPEAIDWLSEREISEAEAKSNLPRAFRNNLIDTRGRSRKFTGHDTQTVLDGSAWDGAVVHWDSSSYSIDGSDRKGVIDIVDVEIRCHDLIKWIGEDGKEAPSASTPQNRSGAKPQYKWEEFYIEISIIADLDGLPDIQAELEKEMANWCLENWGKEPSESTIRAKISPIYNHPRKNQGQ